MDFPSNSKQNNEDKNPIDKGTDKKVERVTSGEVVRRKKSLGKRFTETFMGGDAKNAVTYVFFDVLIPAAKDMITDAISQGTERLLFGEVRSGRSQSRGRPTGPSGYVSYNRFTSNQSQRRNEETRSVSRRSRASHDFDEIILATRVEAEEVIDRLFDLVSKYETATVADLYELVGVTGNYTDDKWGWNDIRGAGVSRVRNGYLLDLPRPEPLD